jgi:diguanylate cyclase (GGDEF)-like protein
MPLARRRALWYAAAGAVLSLGEPIGLLIVREIYAPRPIATELFSERLTYLYLFLTTAIVLACLGYFLGRQTDRLEALSETDALTGLANRRALRRRLTEEFRRSVRYGSPVSLLIVDVDHLKRVNDTQGHAAGDRLIRHVAAAIAGTLRGSDLGARWGGDEFAIVAPNASAKAAHRSAERLVAHLAAEPVPGVSTRATVSIGIATFDPGAQGGADPEELIRAADAAMYVAKTSGRNRIRAA